MSTHGSDNGNGQSLDKGLEDVGRTYGKLEQEQPPALLDQAILNKARREVEGRPRWTQFGWLHGLTTAAVFVLAFSLVLNQRDTAPVEQSIELESGDVMLKVAPGAEGAGQEQVPAERVELRVLQKSATAPAAESRAVDQDDERDVVGGSLRRQAQKPAPSPARDMPELESMAEEEIVLDEVIREDTSFMAVSAPAAADASEPAAAPPEHAKKEETRERLESDDAEQRLAEIIRLKHAGDPAWETALEAFVEEYPGYPLPDELSD